MSVIHVNGPCLTRTHEGVTRHTCVLTQRGVSCMSEARVLTQRPVSLNVTQHAVSVNVVSIST